MSLFLQLLGNGLVQGAVAVLYAASFGFLYRSFRVFHIAMGAQFGFACYAFYTCAAVCKLPQPLHRQFGRCDAMRYRFGNRCVGKCVIILTDKKVGMPKNFSV